MTLQDLWLLIKRYSKWVILVPVICAVLAGGAGALSGVVGGAMYTASSMLTVIDPTGLVSSTSLANLVNVFAQDQAELENNGDNGVTVKAEVDSSTQSIKFEVTAPSEQESMDIANRLAERTADAVQSALVEQGAAYMEAVDEMGNQPLAEEGTYINAGATADERAAALRSCFFSVSSATKAEADGVVSRVVKYLLVGILGGLFLAICALVLIDSVKRPIKSSKDIEAVTDLPVWSVSDSRQAGERLWMNIQFATKGPIGSICLLPVSGGKQMGIKEVISKAMSEEPSGDMGNSGIRIETCDSIGESIVGARIAKEASVTIVTAVCWKDSEPTLCGVLEELRLASANVVGIVLLAGEDAA